MPLAYRVPFQSSCGVFWTLYLSIANSKCVYLIVCPSSTLTVFTEKTIKKIVGINSDKPWTAGKLNAGSSFPHLTLGSLYAFWSCILDI